MAKFCRSCGAPIEEGAAKCNQCGADLTATSAPAPVQQPKNNEKLNEVLDNVSDVLNTCFMVVEKVVRIVAKKAVEIVKNLKNKQANAPANGAAPQKETKLNVVRLAIAVVMIVLCLIAIVQNVTMKYDVSVTATMEYNGEKMSQTESGPMEDLLMDTDEFIPVGIVCLAWAVFNLVLIVMAAILIVKLVRLDNTDRGYTSLAMTGLIGDAIYMILYKICGTGSMDSWGAVIHYTIGFNSFVWIHLVMFALAVAWVYVGKMLQSAPAIGQAAENTEIQ